MTYPEACADPNIFGKWFAGESWARWRVIDKAVFGLPLDDVELPIFQKLTGRVKAPTVPATECWFAMGRRAGKDVKAASLAVYCGTIGADRYLSRLTGGERGVVQILAVDRDQAKICLDYARAMLEQPLLSPLVKRDTDDVIELVNGLALEITTNDRRRVRGRTVVVSILDEVGHWRSDVTSSPDEDVYAAIKPAQATVPGALLIGISSPYARRGLLYRKVTEHFGKEDDPVLVVRASSLEMNPTIDPGVIDEAYRRDPSSAKAEYGGEFRNDVQSFIDAEAVEACVEVGVRERPYNHAWRYHGFIDPSGGRQDSFAMAIAHKEAKTVVLDAIREVEPPFSPENVVAQFSALLRQFRITKIVADHWGGVWPEDMFREQGGIVYESSAQPKSQIYGDVLALINSRAVSLLDHSKMVAQLTALERRTGNHGRDFIDHPPSGHDDVANVVCGVLDLAWQHSDGKPVISYSNERPRQFSNPLTHDPLAAYRVGATGRG